jgi:hypothetical protein
MDGGDVYETSTIESATMPPTNVRVARPTSQSRRRAATHAKRIATPSSARM